MSKRKMFEKYPIYIIRHHRTGKPKLVYKTETCFLNYHSLLREYPLSSEILLENANKKDFKKIKNEIDNSVVKPRKNKMPRKSVHALVICVQEHPKLVYDIGDFYLNAYDYRTTYPKDSPIILGNANKKLFSKLKETQYFKHRINEMNTVKINSVNWLKVAVNDDIRILIDDITNSLTPSRMNANEVIQELERIRDFIDEKIAPVASVVNLINERLLEIARKADAKNRRIVFSDKTAKLLIANNIYANKETPWKYHVSSFVLKKSGERKYRLLKKDQYGEWTEIVKKEDGTWLTFDTFEDAKNAASKMFKEERDLED